MAQYTSLRAATGEKDKATELLKEYSGDGGATDTMRLRREENLWRLRS